MSTFNYDDKVRITSGSLQGMEGKVIDESKRIFSTKYLISFIESGPNSPGPQWINESELELVKRASSR